MVSVYITNEFTSEEKTQNSFGTVIYSDRTIIIEITLLFKQVFKDSVEVKSCVKISSELRNMKCNNQKMT